MENDTIMVVVAISLALLILIIYLAFSGKISGFADRIVDGMCQKYRVFC